MTTKSSFLCCLLALAAGVFGAAAGPLDSLTGYYTFEAQTYSNGVVSNAVETMAAGNPGFPQDSAVLYGAYYAQSAYALPFTTNSALALAGAGAYYATFTNQYGSIAGNPVVVTNDWLVATWFKPNTGGKGITNSSERMMVFETSGGAYPISYGLNAGTAASNTTFQLYTLYANGTSVNSGYVVAGNLVDQWHQIVLVHSNTTIYGFLDGGLAHEISLTTNALSSYAGFNVGTYRSANGRWFQGQMDELAFWQRALSSAEVATLRTAGQGAQTLAACISQGGHYSLATNLVAYYGYDFQTNGVVTNGASALGGGSFADDSLALNSATLLPGAQPVYPITFNPALARVGQGALSCNGSNSYAQISGNPVDPNQSWSVSAWFWPNTGGTGLTGTNRSFIFETAGTNYPISFGLRAGTDDSLTDFQLYTDTSSGSTYADYDLPNTQVDQWHNLVLTYTPAGGVLNGYLDNVLTHNIVLGSGATLLSYSGFNLGTYRSANGRWFEGQIDEVAFWQRTLASDEVAAVYAAGLIGNPLNDAVPGQAPVIITNLPATVSEASGSTLTLSVAATAPDSLIYQWEFNGAVIPGATNASLILSAVDASSQGVYSVLVSDAYGGVLSTSATLSVYTPVVTGQWDFLRGDLRATVGTDLHYVGGTSNLTSFPVTSINGIAVPVMEFGSNSPSEGFLMCHGAMPNEGGQFVNQYTLIMDVMFPASSSGQWRALFQTDPFNHAGNDAELYVGNNASGPNPNGIGIPGGQFNGTIQPATWYRIAFAVDLAAPNGQQLTTFVNGVQVGSQSLPGGIDGQYSLGPAAQLFTTGLAGNLTQPGFVSSIQLVNGWMPPAALAALGAPSAAKLPPGNAVIQITNLSLSSSQLTLDWSGPNGLFQVQTSFALDDSIWQAIGPLSSNSSLTIPASNMMGFYRVTQTQQDINVGPLPNGKQAIPSKEILRAAGSQVQFSGRPVDLALSPDGQTVYIKDMTDLLVVSAASWTLLQTLSFPESGASMHGIAVSEDGAHVYVTGCSDELYDWTVTNGTVSFSRTITLPSDSDPCGLAISGDGTKAYVCLSISNQLAVVDLASGAVSQQIGVGIAPWNVVLSPDGNTAYVSDWGGRFPTNGDLTATSAGTPVVIDTRGVAASGVLSVVNLTTGLETAEVATGLHPSDLALSSDGNTLYVANANSDTVTVIDTQGKTVKETILIRPSQALPFGSEPDGLALSPDGTNLFVACAGNNAIAVVGLPGAQQTNSLVRGFFPTDWYPGALVADGNYVYVANVDGLGTRYGQPTATSYLSSSFLGTADRIPIPSTEALSKYTSQVDEYGRISQIQKAQQAPLAGLASAPVPARAGEPSVFQHVLYIIKENKTYDQMLGDMVQGNGNASLCIYPQNISPNHHALAQQYVLLDNYYCNGVLSADGHNWATQANNTDNIEKSFGGFVRSYMFATITAAESDANTCDPLAFASSGFIWNNVLQHGLTFRNYGEFDLASVPSGASWAQIYADFANGTHSIAFAQNIGVASLRPYSSTNVPGWDLNIPDQVRAYGFIKELNAAQAGGSWPSFNILYLPDDHTGGTPPAQAQVADNDLALGRVVQAVTTSIFASNTVIFVIEDDPQSGYDHVDGHRSLCLVISPYTKRNQVISTFYNQAGVVHTMEQILGLPPMNQQDAMAPLMFNCFTNVPNFTPYTALSNNIDLSTGGLAALSRKARYYAKKVQKMDFSKPDLINDDIFNRYIWYSIKGNARYPSEFVGAHGKGLKKLGLALAKKGKQDDD